jgi:MFS family permease
MNAAWVTLAASFVILAFDRAVSSAFSILILPLQDELSAPRATVTLVFTSHMLVYSLVSLASGLLIARAGPRATIALGGLLLGCGVAGMAAAHSLATLMLTFGVLAGAGIALVGLPANFVIVSNRFPARVATAMGIAAAGMGVGVLLLIPTLQWGAERLGWRTVFVYAGVATAVVVMLCAWMQRLTPDLARDGVPASGRPSSRDATGAGSLARMAALVRAWRWQGFGVTNFLMGSALFGILTHQVALLSEMGWTPVAAAASLGTVNVLRSAAGPLWGYVLDKWGRRVGYALAVVLAVAGAAMLLAAQAGMVQPALAVPVFVAAFGIGSSGTLPTNASLGNELFSADERGIAWGLTETAYAGGAAFGSWIVGWSFDVSGNYAIALALVAAQFIVSYALVVQLSPRPRVVRSAA